MPDEYQITSPTSHTPPIIRHDNPPKKSHTAQSQSSSKEINDHIQKHIGKIESIFLDETDSDHLNININWVKPTTKRPVYTLITSGMSDLPMTIPKDSHEPKHVELIMTLPSYWKFDEKSLNALNGDQWYWPIDLLKDLAKFPHQHNANLGPYHILPNSDPPQPYGQTTDLCCAFITPSVLTSTRFNQLKINENKKIHFYSVVGLFQEEMDYKLQHGTEALVLKLQELGLKDIVYPQRNACIPQKNKKRRFGFF